jgi:myo-inositol 2-dehydrogenase/D-chiro-inositol 1-dehydrogenase
MTETFIKERKHNLHQFADFLQTIGEGKECAPTFRDGLATDHVTDAVLKSAKTRQWERVSQ